MFRAAGAAVCWVALFTLVHSHAMPTVGAQSSSPRDGLRVEPTESMVPSGANVSFVCSTPLADVPLRWEPVQSALFEQQKGLTEVAGRPLYYSRITLLEVTRAASGEVVCATEHERATAVLLVNGVPNGAPCRSTVDCVTAHALCVNGVCDCPKHHVHLRIKEKSLDICKEMIYSLYDPCEFDEQCAFLVDPNSVCKAVCVCAPWAKDRRGHCIVLGESSRNQRSQEMYRVGLIAVTCIIILVVAVSLWVTLKKSCHEPSRVPEGRRMSSNRHHPRVSLISLDLTGDKPPSYEDIIVTKDTNVNSPPNFKDALKHCMTAKKLQRQVSAPAGQLLTQLDIDKLKNSCKGQ